VTVDIFALAKCDKRQQKDGEGTCGDFQHPFHTSSYRFFYFAVFSESLRSHGVQPEPSTAQPGRA
jgi:hypothetical protein